MRVMLSPTERKASPIPVSSDRYVKELDGIRAVAIAIVLVRPLQATAGRNSWRFWRYVVLLF